MARTPQLLDANGRPMMAETLKAEVAAATMGGVRSPLTGYPADGMHPQRLAQILREADAGDPIRFLELAETIEERDLHYLGVLGTRRRAVTQLDITIKAASDDPKDEAIAQGIRDWLDRDELADELFHILDCIGKGYSATEIIWDYSEGQWSIEKLEHRDPRWFEFDRVDLSTPLLRGPTGLPEPLPGGKFIFARIAAKSGLPLRSGIARVAAWAWMFKAFTQRDWTIFTQTYGQPIRLGKYGAGATDADKATLMRAVANIAGDMAAIIPESMMIELIAAPNVGAAAGLYKERADWLDQQVSKAVLGQTATTDAVTGGLGSGKEHRQVQEDIERADAKALAAVLNRDLIIPWVKLNHGEQKRYPRLKIERPEQEDLSAFAGAIGPMIDRGLEVAQEDVRSKFNLPEPKAGARLMTANRPAPAPPEPPVSPGVTPPDAPDTEPDGADREIKRNPGEIKRGQPLSGISASLQAEGPSTARKSAPSPDEVLADRMMIEAEGATEAMLARIEAMVAAATSLDELKAMFLAGFPDLPGDELAAVLGLGLTAANAGGRIAAAEEAEG
jgi:phage gp29-like protein